MTDNSTASTQAYGVDRANADDRSLPFDTVPPTHGDGGDTNGAMDQEKDYRQDSPMAVDVVSEPLSSEYCGHSLMASQHAPSMLSAEETTQHVPALKKRSAVARRLPLEQKTLPSAGDSTLVRPGQTFAPKRVFTIPSPTAPSQSSSSIGDGARTEIVNIPLTEVTAPDCTETETIFEVNLDGSTTPVASLPADVVWYRPSDKTGESVGPYVGLTGVHNGAAASSAAVARTSAPSHEKESGARDSGTLSDPALQTDRSAASSQLQHSVSPFESQPTVSTAWNGLFGQPSGTLTQPTASVAPTSFATSTQSLTSFGQRPPSLSRASTSSFGHAQPLSPFGQLSSASNEHDRTSFGLPARQAQSSFGSTYTAPSRPSTLWFGQPSPSFLGPPDSSFDRKSLSVGQQSTSLSQKTGLFGQASTPFGQPSMWSTESSTAVAQISPFSVTSESMQRPTTWDTVAREHERATDGEAWHRSDRAPIDSIRDELEDGEIELDDPSDVAGLSPWSRRQAMPPPPKILVPFPKFEPTLSVAADHGSKDKGPKQVNAKTSPVDKHRESLLNIAKDRIVSRNGGVSVVIEAWEEVLEILKRPKFQRKMNSSISAAMHEKHRKQRDEMQARLKQDDVKMAARAQDRHKQMAFEALSRDLRHDRRTAQKRQLDSRWLEDNSRIEDRFE